jgi:FxLD family lantipeptide
MTVTTTEALPGSNTDAPDEDDPFGLDITFIEGTAPAQQPLLCATDDTCGSSCPSACTTS